MSKSVKVGDPWQASSESGLGDGCDERSPDTYRFYCCRPANHRGKHIAGNGSVAVAVWK